MSVVTIHNCPVQGCSWQVSSDKLMCAAHWKLVPQYLQQDVSRYWQQMNSGDNQRRLLAIHNYRVARDAAIKAVDGLLSPLASA